MYKFIVRLTAFLAFSCIAGEIIVRTFQLVPDIPRLFVDSTGIQRYVPGQAGFYTRGRSRWLVNEYGWLGVAETDKDTIISIIGDSYIENIMNPISCNQGSILKTFFKNIGFFEAGRSGVTFIEAMEITKLLDAHIKPDLHLLYISKDNLDESISSVIRYPDRMQIDLHRRLVLAGKLKSPGLKKILYNVKLAYYLYLRFPMFIALQNKGGAGQYLRKGSTADLPNYERLFGYCADHYDLTKITLVFHPGTEQEIIDLAKHFGYNTVALNADGHSGWELGSHDGHWSCYGHQQAAKQVRNYLYRTIAQ